MKSLIVLTGMMGCGKTSVGELLAEKLNYSFLDVDKEIEKAENKTISQIFNDDGEQYFRFLEKEKIEDLSELTNTVLALGGGAFENEETRKLLKKNGKVIYLKATPQVIFERIKNEIHRPLLKKNFSVETISFILKKRVVNYEKADFIIDTDKYDTEGVVKKIIEVLK